MTVEKVHENLKKLIGTEFDSDEVICAFEDFEEDGEDYVHVSKSSNWGYDYIAYIAAENSTQFLFDVNEDDVITDVRIRRTQK